jgi:hypothetical protein
MVRLESFAIAADDRSAFARREGPDVKRDGSFIAITVGRFGVMSLE